MRTRIRGYHPSIITIGFADFIRGFTRYPLWILVSIYLLSARHFNYIDIGLVFLAQSIFTVPFSIYGGRISDIRGRRELAIIMPAILSISYMLFFLVIYFNLSLVIITVMMVDISILSTVQYNINNSILTDLSSETQRLNSFSLVRVLSNAGIGVGLMFSGLISILNPAYFFLAPVFGSIVEVVIYYKYVPESLPVQKDKTARTVMKFSFSKDRLLIVVSLVMAFSSLMAGMFESPITPLYLTSRFSYSEFQITILYAVNTLVVILFQFKINRLSRRIGEIPTYSLGLVLYAAAYLIFGVVGIFPILIMIVTMLTFGENMTSQFSQVFISRIAPENRRGEYFGYSSAVFSFIYPFTPLVGTLILQSFNFSPLLVWGTISGLCLMMAMISLSLRKMIPDLRNSNSYKYSEKED
ncbi:MAG: MFS transporter [Thermoplasmataceae archaeon]